VKFSKDWLAVGAVLLLLGGTGGVLARLSEFQKLGAPGVRVVPVPVLDDKGGLVGTNSVFLPETVWTITSTSLPIATVVKEWLPKDTTYGQRVYYWPDRFGVQVNVVLMGTDRTSIHKPEYCLPGQGWRIVKSEAVSLPLDRPMAHELPVQRLSLRKEFQHEGKNYTQEAVYAYWFICGDALSNDHWDRWRKMAGHALRTGELQRWAAVMVFAPVSPGMEAEAAWGRVRHLITETAPQFHTFPRAEK
jgi:EpsI family protein